MRTAAPELLLRTVLILDAFDAGGEPLTVGEISARTGLPTSTTYRLLSHLVALGILAPGSDAGRVRLGGKLVEWGGKARRGIDVRREGMRAIKDLQRETGETVQLAVREGLDGVFVEILEAGSGIHHHAVVGQHVPLHAGASMRLLLAHAPQHVREEVLGGDSLSWVGPGTVTDPREQLAMGEEVIRQGYAISVGEIYDGAVAVAVPVREAGGAVVAALSVSGPMQRWSPERARAALPVLWEAAAEVSGRLGYKDGGETASKGRGL